MLIDNSGAANVTASYRYDPFGNTISISGTNAASNLYRFSSKEVDLNYTDSGLYYYGYRFYDPNLQRWLNRDPIGEQGGINLYRYVGNTPILYFDALGLCYIDFNFSFGAIFGLTFGLMIDPNCFGCGLHPYIGPGIVTPGFSAAITYSDNSPTPGWNFGVSVASIGAIQMGIDPAGEEFFEFGLGFPPSAGVFGYHVW
jgi:RHS repeat-associated protein